MTKKSAAIVDEKLYSVVDRLTGYEQRFLTHASVHLVLATHLDRVQRYGWREETRVFYRDGTDVTKEFRS